MGPGLDGAQVLPILGRLLGSQDAARKRRLDNGPWAGTIFGTSYGAITKSVTDAK